VFIVEPDEGGVLLDGGTLDFLLEAEVAALSEGDLELRHIEPLMVVLRGRDPRDAPHAFGLLSDVVGTLPRRGTSGRPLLGNPTLHTSADPRPVTLLTRGLSPRDAEQVPPGSPGQGLDPADVDVQLVGPHGVEQELALERRAGTPLKDGVGGGVIGRDVDVDLHAPIIVHNNATRKTTMAS